ncbi:helix-turn-helix domain-containing protein [Mycobacterium syngnathidarum]
MAIVELLAGSEPSSVASIAAKLELNRSTTTSVLSALGEAGWVTRHPDRRYTLGAGLIGVADAVRRSLPLSRDFVAVVDELAQRAGCGASISLVSATELTFLHVVPGQGQIPAGVQAGVRLPLVAPVGVAVMAQRERDAQDAWLAASRTVSRPLLEDVLSQVRRSGVAIFGLGDSDPEMLTVLGEVVELLAEHPMRTELRHRALGLLVGLSGHPYTAEQLAAPDDLPVSYLTAAVSTAEGQAGYELQLGPLSPGVSALERDRYCTEIRSAADKLDGM